MSVDEVFVDQNGAVVRRVGDYELKFVAGNLSADGHCYVRAEKLYVAVIRGEVLRWPVDIYHIVGDITRHTDNAFTCRFHTASWEYFPLARIKRFVGRLENKPIRGLEGAARSIQEALIKIALHYDESKDNLIAMAA